MAKIKFGATVVGARGTLGGITFSANKSGPYIKQWARSSTPRSALQQAQRITWATSAEQWQNLTGAQRTGWDTFASTTAPPEVDAFGDDYRISGFAWYTRSTSLRAAGGFVPLGTAPVSYNVHVPVVTNLLFFITGGTGASRSSYPSGTFGPTKWFFLYGAVLSSIGAISPNIKMKRIVAESNPTLTFIAFQDEIETAFGEIELGMRLIWRLHVCDDDGYLSVPLTGSRDAAP